MVRLDQMRLAEVNPREISDRNLAGLRACIARFGFVEPIVWNERTGNIVGGHQRYRVLVERGAEQALAVVVDFEKDEEAAAALVLNNPAIQGEWDEPILQLMDQVEVASGELFEELNMESLRQAVTRKLNAGGGGGGDPDELTRCPYCKHEWELSSRDIAVEKVAK